MVRKKCWSGSVDQVTPVATKSWETEEILNILKVRQEQTKKTWEQIGSTLAASSPDMKKSWCLWMEANVNDINPSVDVVPGSDYQMIKQYFDQSAAIRQSATGQAEPKYILCNLRTGVAMSQASQVSTFPRVTSLAPSLAFGSQIRIIMTTCRSIL